MCGCLDKKLVALLVLLAKYCVHNNTTSKKNRKQKNIYSTTTKLVSVVTPQLLSRFDILTKPWSPQYSDHEFFTIQ